MTSLSDVRVCDLMQHWCFDCGSSRCTPLAKASTSSIKVQDTRSIAHEYHSQILLNLEIVKRLLVYCMTYLQDVGKPCCMLFFARIFSSGLKYS
jgi:hypothetical protein